jgi:hypothetical protein
MGVSEVTCTSEVVPNQCSNRKAYENMRIAKYKWDGMIDLGELPKADERLVI